MARRYHLLMFFFAFVVLPACAPITCGQLGTVGWCIPN